jgi:glycosyltransferase involved in cell wall biosynthesis
MRILSITAGAGGMYCGSCLQDNALASELIARGHDVTLIPLYTPLLTDEPNVTRPHVLFGGISVYLQQYASIFRRMPRFVDRLLDSPRLINAFAGRSLSVDPKLLGDLTISMLEGTDGVLRREFDKLLEWVSNEPKPDIVSITNSMLLGLARPLAEALGRPITCALQGEDFFLDGLIEPYKSRALDLLRRRVRDVDRFIAVSDYYASFMKNYLRIPGDRITVVPLGINLKGFERAAPATAEHPADAASRNSRDEVFRIGYFARVAPEKGLHLLAQAFIRLHQRVGNAPLRLEAAGYLAPAHEAYLSEVRRLLSDANLLDAFAYRGVVDRDGKIAFMRDLDVLSVPATFDDSKGLPLLEAMASGVPVVQPDRGSFSEIVRNTGGGLLVRPDDPDSLAEGLYSLWHDRAMRAQLGTRGREGVREHYTIQRSAATLLRVYQQIIAQRDLHARPDGRAYTTH